MGLCRELVDVTASHVPKNKPLEISPKLSLTKTTSGALRITDKDSDTSGSWNDCLASAQRIISKTGGEVSTTSLTMYTDAVPGKGGVCFVPPAGGGGL